MTIKSETLRPGFLVSLKSSTTGNVQYIKTEIASGTRADGASEATWETTRIIIDEPEHDRATKARTKARSIVTSVCTSSAFGLLCPEDKAEQLEASVRAARKVAEEFNETSKLSKVHVYVITGRVASDDLEAVKAINSEVRELMDDMQTGLRNLDVKKIRDAASKVKSIGQMLSPEMEARVRIAVDTARKTASQIAAAGETAAVEVDLAAVRKITDMRTAFLDIDTGGEVGVPEADARAVDFATDEPRRAQDGYQPEQPAIELDGQE